MPKFSYLLGGPEGESHLQEKLLPDEFKDVRIDTDAPLYSHFATVNIPYSRILRKRNVRNGKPYKNGSNKV